MTLNPSVVSPATTIGSSSGGNVAGTRIEWSGLAQVPGLVGAGWQLKSMQTSPPEHVPQLPPQPSLPHCCPLQWGTQFVWHFTQPSGAGSGTTFVHRPEAGSQVSTVQSRPSSQGSGPATHSDPFQRSSPSQKLPLLHVTSVRPGTGAPKLVVPP